MKHRNIYLASTLALFSLTALAYTKPTHIQADSITENGATSVTNIANNSATTPTSQQPASQQASTSATPSNSNANNSEAPVDSVTLPASSSAVTPTSSTVSTANAEETQAKVAAQYTVSQAAARTAYDGTPIISIGDSQYPRVDAVDVSAYQAGLNYNNFVSLKNAGVKTVIVKLTEGTGYTNQYAGQQINNARNAGLNIQVYHYAHFGSWNTAVSEANHLANVMNALRLSKDTRIYADMEDTTTKYAGIANDLNGFWTQLNNLGFTNHAVYTSLAYDRQYNVSATVGKNRTWVAQYLYNPSYLANQSYGAWQFNAHGTIPGYNGELDLSIDYQNLLTGDTGHWNQNNNHWYYNQNGQNVTGWQKINGSWYYFNNDGAAQTGWFKSGAGNWYYFDQNNAWALTGWQWLDNNWLYFDPTNAWQDKGWQKINGRWYY
ncbi:GH25 family lysozyme, partial [Limosilactobacillus galli]|uniref:GH25 family lysozyme n=1 Tax=Limosilactobacillus galli TaxID=2991834 RepID=UPI0024B9F47A